MLDLLNTIFYQPIIKPIIDTYLVQLIAEKVRTAPLPLLIALALFVAAVIAGRCVVFNKSGVSWWKGLIPVYSSYKLHALAGCQPLFWAKLVVSCIFIVLGIILIKTTGLALFFLIVLGASLIVNHFIFSRHLAEVYSQDKRFALGLFFLHPVFLLMLGFSDAEHHDPYIGEKASETWTCPSCGQTNYVSRLTCSSCHTMR